VGKKYLRHVIFALILLSLGFIALTRTYVWQDFITGKERFITYNPEETVGVFHGKTVRVPPLLVFNTSSMDEVSSRVLGDTSNKRIEVDLTNQRVYAFEGDTKVYEFVVSTGLWGLTPTGEFTIQRRVRVQTMSGGNRALGTYYYLPGVQFVQYFGNRQIPWWRGFSFHAAYWHNDFGRPKSHGCINMKTEDALTLWNWTENTGTRVIIYGTTPTS
jgi:lipoprotein-anchoring transpeptidase ErfK/SrfK